MANIVQILVVESNNRLRQVIQDLIEPEVNYHIAAFSKTGAQVPEMVRKSHPDIVIVDTDLQDMSGYEVCKAIVAEEGGPLVLMTSESDEMQAVRLAMRAGAREFIAADKLETDLIPMMKELLQSTWMDDSAPGAGKVIACVSAKGGMGKSTVSANVTAELAKRYPGRVLAMDFDAQFGDIAILCNLNPNRTLSHLVESGDVVDIDLLRAHITTHQLNFDVLPAPKRPEYGEYVGFEHLNQAIRLARHIYDWIVIDAAQGFNTGSLAGLDNADLVLMVTTADLPALKNVKLALDSLQGKHYDRTKIGLVLNRVTPRFGIRAKEIEAQFKYPVLGQIPVNYDVVLESANQGTPFVARAPQSNVAREVRALVDRLEKVVREGASAQPASDGTPATGSFMSRFFSRL